MKNQAVISILIAIGFVLALVWLVSLFPRGDKPAPKPQPPRAVAIDADGEWLTYHGDYSLTGFAPASFPRRPVRVWRTRVGKFLPSPIVAAGGRMYCVADDTVVTALDGNGTILWTRTFPADKETAGTRNGKQMLLSPPLLIYDKLLVVCTAAGTVYGLTPSDGKIKWTHNAGAAIQGSPSFLEPTDRQPGRIIVITQEDGFMHALNFVTGASVWKSQKMERTDGHPAAGDNRVVFVNCACTFFQVDGNTGKVLEKSVFLGEGHEMAGGVAFLDGIAYAGNRKGGLVAADMNTGTVVWRTDGGGGELFTTPAVTESAVVFTDSRGHIRCVNRETGKEIWDYDADTGGLTDPVIAGTTVLAGADDKLLALRLTDGTLAWSIRVSDEFTAPSIVGNLIVVGTDDGHVAAYAAGGEQ